MGRAEIIEYCRMAIGCSYDYTPSGGVEWESYNCSYLTTCAYRYGGYDIPSWQGHQNGDGSQSDWVRQNGNWTEDVDELEAGDLLFFGDSPYNTGHVGIYVGNGQMIDSVPNGGVQQRYVYGSFVGGGWPLAEVPEAEEWQILPAKGTVRFKYGMFVRDYPSTVDGDRVGDGISYQAGETCNIDGIVLNDGRVWGHYIGASSRKDRYVALTDVALAFAEVVD